MTGATPRDDGLDIPEAPNPASVLTGVQHMFHPPGPLEAWPDEDRRSRLAFITRDLTPEMFAHMLQAFNEQGTGPNPTTSG